MVPVIVLSAAVLCFGAECVPVIVGKTTPVGAFALEHVTAPVEPYGGDALVFDRSGELPLAVHRAINAHRHALLDRRSPPSARAISKGCVNVQDAVYNRLRDCCTAIVIVR
jgi:hypothetical protein